jgi:DUF177 domain-containing protein
VKIRIEDIKETEKETAFVEEVSEINDSLANTGVVDYQFQAPVPVEIRYYRLGDDLFFHGRFDGVVTGTCARCLSEYPFPLRDDFTFVLKPAGDPAADQALAEDDVSLSFYDDDGVDLSPLVRESMILSLPTRPLCGEECRGLCPHCGANRNTTECACRDEWSDPRLDVLRTLKR